MSDTTSLPQRIQDVVSPNKNSGWTTGHYSVQHVWVIDATTLVPVGVNLVVTPDSTSAIGPQVTYA